MDTDTEPLVGGGPIIKQDDLYVIAHTQLYVYFNLHSRAEEELTGDVRPVRQTILHFTPAPEKVRYRSGNDWSEFTCSDDLRAKAALMAVGLMPAEIFADCLQEEHSVLEWAASEIRHCQSVRRYGDHR